MRLSDPAPFAAAHRSDIKVEPGQVAACVTRRMAPSDAIDPQGLEDCYTETCTPGGLFFGPCGAGGPKESETTWAS